MELIDLTPFLAKTPDTRNALDVTEGSRVTLGKLCDENVNDEELVEILRRLTEGREARARSLHEVRLPDEYMGHIKSILGQI